MGFRGFRQASGNLVQRGLAGLDVAFQFGGVAFEFPEVAAQRQRPGARAFASGHQPVLIVLSRPGQKVAFGISARETLSRRSVFDQIGVGK